MNKSEMKASLIVLHAKGFDKSYISGSHVAVKCSQCEALVIQGVPAHETRCPNTTLTCRECGAPVPLKEHSHLCRDCRA